MTALFPGSFDPVTVGHLDIIERACALFDRVIVAVVHNPQKPSGALTVDQRLQCLWAVAEDFHNVEFVAETGLLVNIAQRLGASCIVRGVRTAGEMDTELAMARLNRELSGLETLFLPALPAHTHVSATYVREIGRLDGPLFGLVPEPVVARVAQWLSSREG